MRYLWCSDTENGLYEAFDVFKERSMTVTHGTNSGSWHGNSSPTPPKPQQPIIDAPATRANPLVRTQFTFEGWTIHFQETEPHAWFISHDECSSFAITPVKDGKSAQTIFFGQKHLETDIECEYCKTPCPKYTWLILHRTRQMLLRSRRMSK